MCELDQVTTATDPTSGMTGCMPAFNISTSVSTTSGRTAERPCANEKARAAMVARTTRSGCAGPSPTAWLRTRFRWNSGSASLGITRSHSGPQPVLRP